MVRKLALVLLALVPSVALADKKVLPLDQHQGPLFLDESTSSVQLAGQRSGYGVHIHLRLYGVASKTDRIRVEWKQGGKLLATLKCDPEINLDKTTAGGNCEYNERNLTATGPIDADVIYSDDQAEKDYLVRTFHVTAKKWAGIGKDVTWQIAADDVLGGAFARQWSHDETWRTQFVFWLEKHNSAVKTSLRCTVDGTKLDDIEANVEDMESGVNAIEANSIGPKAETSHHWNPIKLNVPQLYVGLRDVVSKGHNYHGGKDAVFLGDHPGKWECKLRSDGTTFRELRFTVGDKGTIQQDEINTGKGAIPMAPDVELIDIRIPKDSKFDERVRPDAMRKSFNFGLAWPSHAKVKEIHGSFPASYGPE